MREPLSSLRKDLDASPLVLMEGAVVERVRRGHPENLDPLLMNAHLVASEEGRSLLRPIYRDYLNTGAASGLPMICLTPTWRATPGRIAQSPWTGQDLNGMSAWFMDSLRRESGDYAAKIYVGGLMGCRGDAYRPEEGLSTEEGARFHRVQAEALAAGGVDLLFGSTLPALPEAVGMAQAFSQTGPDYLISFIIRPSGRLLDGTPLEEAVDRIDQSVARPPAGYMVNCIHPSVLRAALESSDSRRQALHGRLLGLQANTSAKAPEELDGSEELDGDEPRPFAEAMAGLYKDFGLKVFGGCCGTDGRHISAMARALIP